MLAGRTVLIVESEFLIALDIQRMLEHAGAGLVTIARGPNEAYAHLSRGGAFDLAIVDILEGDPQVIDMLERLRQEGAAIIGVTADFLQGDGPTRLVGMPILLKPVSEKVLMEAIRTLSTEAG